MKSKSKRVFGLFAIMLVLATGTFATDYYVATTGDDDDPGTFAEPFATIQKAADTMSAGDTCYIRSGTYHETVSAADLDGSSGNPITFTNYQDEEVILDGTVAITGEWTQYSGNIYKLSYSTDVWQLFVDGNMMISARWPNATWVQNWNDDTYWGHCRDSSTNGHLYDDPHGSVNLAGTNKSFTDGIAILNLGNWTTEARTVGSHTAGQNHFTYNAVNDYQSVTSKHRYFLECKLNMLDAEKEWYYDSSGDMLYLWAPGGNSPSGTIKGKTQSFAFDLTSCDYIVIEGLKFFATTFSLSSCLNCSVKNCDLEYASYSKRMLGNVGEPDVTTVWWPNQTNQSNFTLYNCSIKYTDGPAIWMRGKDNVIENCYFQDIDYSTVVVAANSFTIHTMSSAGITYKRNTIKTAGAAQAFRGGFCDDGNYPMLVEYNYHYNCGLLQTDGATLQLGANSATDCEARYNWTHSSPKKGLRLDGNIGDNRYSTNALVHHNVAWDQGNNGLTIKGDYHKTYNNTAFNCEDPDANNDVDIPVWDEDGIANQHSITRNDAANEISGDLFDPGVTIPGTKSNNWTGYVQNELRDPDNMDFRPKSDSDLVDAGYVISGITDGYIGDAPDIGAYEDGCTNYWIPGRKEKKASMPVPRDDGVSVPTDADLMWLEGLNETSSNVYFGTVSGSLSYQSNQTNNIYDPGTLSGATTYYWRVDTVTASGTITGDEWSFYTVPPVPVWTELTYDDFESGWGNYTDTGANCLLYTGGSTYAHQGTAAANIQGNTTESIFRLTNGIDVHTPGYTKIRVEFWFKTNSMESGEDFWVMYYNGISWSTVKSYVSGTDFSNGAFYDQTGANAVIINEGPYTFPTDMKIRFRCDASDDTDDVYIDEIKISAK